MNTRAKFVCQRIEPSKVAGEDNAKVILTAVTVYNDGEDKAEFWKYTPSGEISLWISNPAAVNVFEVGKKYYVDFSEVTE